MEGNQRDILPNVVVLGRWPRCTLLAEGRKEKESLKIQWVSKAFGDWAVEYSYMQQVNDGICFSYRLMWLSDSTPPMRPETHYIQRVALCDDGCLLHWAKCHSVSSLPKFNWLNFCVALCSIIDLILRYRKATKHWYREVIVDWSLQMKYKCWCILPSFHQYLLSHKVKTCSVNT